MHTERKIIIDEKTTADEVRLSILQYADPVHFWAEYLDEEGNLQIGKQNSRNRPYPIYCKNSGTYQRATVTKAKIAAHCTSFRRLHFTNSPLANVWQLLIEIDHKEGHFAESLKLAQKISTQHLHGRGYTERSRGGNGAYLYFRFDRTGISTIDAIACVKAFENHLKERYPSHLHASKHGIATAKIDAIKAVPYGDNPAFDESYADSECYPFERFFVKDMPDHRPQTTVTHYEDFMRRNPGRCEYINSLERIIFDQHSSAPAPAGWRQGDTPAMVGQRIAAYLEWSSATTPLTLVNLNVRLIPGSAPVVAATDEELDGKVKQRDTETRFARLCQLEEALDTLHDRMDAATTARDRRRINRRINKLADLNDTADAEAAIRKALGRPGHRNGKFQSGEINAMMASSNNLRATLGTLYQTLHAVGDLGEVDTCRLAMDLYEQTGNHDGNRDEKRIKRFRGAYRRAVARFQARPKQPVFPDEDLPDLHKLMPSMFSGSTMKQLQTEAKKYRTSITYKDLARLYLVASYVIIKTGGHLPTAFIRALDSDIEAWSGSKLRIALGALEGTFLECTGRDYQFLSAKSRMPALVKRRCRRYNFAHRAPLPQFAIKHVPHSISMNQRARYMAPTAQAAGPQLTPATPVIVLPQTYWSETEIDFSPWEPIYPSEEAADAEMYAEWLESPQIA